MENKPEVEDQNIKEEVQGEAFSDGQAPGKIGTQTQNGNNKDGEDEELDDELLDEVMGDMEEKLNLTAGERSVGGEIVQIS